MRAERCTGLGLRDHELISFDRPRHRVAFFGDQHQIGCRSIFTWMRQPMLGILRRLQDFFDAFESREQLLYPFAIRLHVPRVVAVDQSNAPLGYNIHLSLADPSPLRL